MLDIDERCKTLTHKKKQNTYIIIPNDHDTYTFNHKHQHVFICNPKSYNIFNPKLPTKSKLIAATHSMFSGV